MRSRRGRSLPVMAHVALAVLRSVAAGALALLSIAVMRDLPARRSVALSLLRHGNFRRKRAFASPAARYGCIALRTKAGFSQPPALYNGSSSAAPARALGAARRFERLAHAERKARGSALVGDSGMPLGILGKRAGRLLHRRARAEGGRRDLQPMAVLHAPDRERFCTA